MDNVLIVLGIYKLIRKILNLLFSTLQILFCCPSNINPPWSSEWIGSAASSPLVFRTLPWGKNFPIYILIKVQFLCSGISWCNLAMPQVEHGPVLASFWKWQLLDCIWSSFTPCAVFLLSLSLCSTHTIVLCAMFTPQHWYQSVCSLWFSATKKNMTTLWHEQGTQDAHENWCHCA